MPAIYLSSVYASLTLCLQRINHLVIDSLLILLPRFRFTDIKPDRLLSHSSLLQWLPTSLGCIMLSRPASLRAQEESQLISNETVLAILEEVTLDFTIHGCNKSWKGRG